MAIDLFEAMYSQRAIRRFRPDPVPDDLIARVLEAATQGPSGGNRQSWGFIVIKDPHLKSQIATYYRRSFQNVYRPGDPSGIVLDDKVATSASYLADHFTDAPVFIMACTPQSSTASLASGSSIYPAVQNLMLAARGLGLGTVITTLHRRYQKEIKALLGIPNDVETAALIPLGYPQGVGFGPLNRRPASEVSFLNRWGNPFHA